MSNAKDLECQADKTVKGGFFSCLAGNRRYDDASDLYQQAATQYKLTKEWQDAANCYMQCAFCAQRTGDPLTEASFHTEAGNMLKRISSSQAIEQFEQAVSLHTAAGKFGQAGKLLVEMAELLEAEQLKPEDTKTFYKRAVEMFDLDDHNKSNCTKCNLKIAEFSARDGDYPEAIRLFESEGDKALENTMLQFGAKEHFLRAGILHLVVGDSVTVNVALEKYVVSDPRFATSREGELLKGLAAAFEAEDVDAFVQALEEYDSVTKLDAWKTQFLLKVKESMSPAAQEDLDLT